MTCHKPELLSHLGMVSLKFTMSQVRENSEVVIIYPYIYISNVGYLCCYIVWVSLKKIYSHLSSHLYIFEANYVFATVQHVYKNVHAVHAPLPRPWRFENGSLSGCCRFVLDSTGDAWTVWIHFATKQKGSELI